MENIKTLKDFLKFKTGKSLDLTYPIKLFDEEGNRIYYENSSGFWYKRKFNKYGNETYFENSNNFWSIQEFDEEGNQIYYENSDRDIDNNKLVKEISVASIEKALGHKVKVIK